MKYWLCLTLYRSFGSQRNLHIACSTVNQNNCSSWQQSVWNVLHLVICHKQFNTENCTYYNLTPRWKETSPFASIEGSVINSDPLIWNNSLKSQQSNAKIFETYKWWAQTTTVPFRWNNIFVNWGDTVHFRRDIIDKSKALYALLSPKYTAEIFLRTACVIQWWIPVGWRIISPKTFWF